MIFAVKQKNKTNMNNKNSNLVIVTLIGVGLFVLFLISKCSGEEENLSVNEVKEEVVEQPRTSKLIRGYRKEHISTPEITEETPTDEGFLVVDGKDSVEFCTDILAGQPYRIIIEGERRTPLCKLLNANGDSTEWDYATQVLRFSNDSVFMARLMVGDKVFPFGISEELDSIPSKQFCNFSFAEMVNNKKDSIHSGATKFPILGSATILFHTAAKDADKLYLKVKQPGLINVTVVYDPSVCGYPLFWDNDSIKFDLNDDSENRDERGNNHDNGIVAIN